MENIDTPSMAISVRFKHRSESDAKNDIRHDLRRGPQPKYVDGTRTRLNTTIVQPTSPAILRDLCIKRRELQPMSRKPKGSFTVASSSIITFGRGLQSHVDALDQERQDELFKAVAEAVAAHLGIELTGLVGHRDEVATHAHGQHPGRHPDGRPMGKVITPKIASELQDVAMEAAKPFLPMIERGKKKADRIADGDDPSTFINRSVRQLHDDLPKEHAAARARLAVAIEREEKNRRLAEKAEADLAALKKDDAKARAKIEKRLATYQHRLSTARGEADSSEARLVELRHEIDQAKLRAQDVVADAEADAAITRIEAQQDADEIADQARADGYAAGVADAEQKISALVEVVNGLKDRVRLFVGKLTQFLPEKAAASVERYTGQMFEELEIASRDIEALSAAEESIEEADGLSF